MYKVEWGYRGQTNVHSQEFDNPEMADTLVDELKASAIVGWTCLIRPNGETFWF